MHRRWTDSEATGHTSRNSDCKECRIESPPCKKRQRCHLPMLVDAGGMQSTFSWRHAASSLLPFLSKCPDSERLSH